MARSSTENKDRFVNKILGSILKNLDGEYQDIEDKPSARDVLGAVASWGGKSKDEIVQVLCREIGVATAAVLKEPLNQVLENRKLRITMELVPKSPDEGSEELVTTAKKTSLRKKRSKTTTTKKRK